LAIHLQRISAKAKRQPAGRLLKLLWLLIAVKLLDGCQSTTYQAVDDCELKCRHHTANIKVAGSRVPFNITGDADLDIFPGGFG
jgi:hypothetical protein